MKLIDVTNSHADLVREQLANTDAQFVVENPQMTPKEFTPLQDTPGIEGEGGGPLSVGSLDDDLFSFPVKNWEGLSASLDGFLNSPDDVFLVNGSPL